MTWWTTPSRTEPQPAPGVAPGLLFHKWHCYDEPEDGRRFQVKGTRLGWLRRVASAVDASAAEHGALWERRYLGALGALGARCPRAVTATRLAAGLATNPALENGLHLHPLYGFPVVPGSTVKGLVHSVAERELIADPRFAGGTFLADTAAVEAFLTAAETIWRIFGGLSLEPMTATPSGTPPAVPAEAIALIAVAREMPEPLRLRARLVLEEARIGCACFYDGFPAMEPRAPRCLLEADILNPHYPDYYDSGNRWQAGGGNGVEVPSDDQDPRPVYFLTVRAGVEFVFPWRYMAVPEPGGEPAGGFERVVERVEAWLHRGLAEWGLGGKTAAGYGYFGAAGEVAVSSGPEGRRPIVSADPPATAVWQGVTVRFEPSKRHLLTEHEGQPARSEDRTVADRLPEVLRKRLFSGRRQVTCTARVAWQREGYYRIEELLE